MFSQTLQNVDSNVTENIQCSVLSNLTLFLKYKYIVDCFTNNKMSFIRYNSIFNLV